MKSRSDVEISAASALVLTPSLPCSGEILDRGDGPFVRSRVLLTGNNQTAENPTVSEAPNVGVNMRHVPWHVKGVRPEVREVARSAARRCGLSVGAWLNSLIVNAAVHRDAAAPGYRPPAPLDPAAPFQPTCIDDAAFAAIRKGVIESLEQRIDTLIKKLENSESPSDRREGTDHRVDELLSQLKELRARNENGLAAIQQQLATTVADAISGPAESIRRDVASLKEIQASVDRRTQDTFEAVYGTMEEVVDRLATIEDGLQDRHFAMHADQFADEPKWRGEPIPAPYPPPAPTLPATACGRGLE